MATGKRSTPPKRSPRKRRGGSSYKGSSNGNYILERSAALPNRPPCGNGAYPYHYGRHAYGMNLYGPSNNSNTYGAHYNYGSYPYGTRDRGADPRPSHGRSNKDYRRHRHDVRHVERGDRHHERSTRPSHHDSRRENKRRSRPPKKARQSANRNNRNNSSKNTALKPIKVRASGIMTHWKKMLGGLIRYYVHKRTTSSDGTTANTVDQNTAEEEIDQMYYRSGCSVEDTKSSILKALGVNCDQEWITLEMAVEKTPSTPKTSHKQTIDSKGLLLTNTLRPGEGPAHHTSTWTTVVVPPWAVGQSYYFQVTNHTPLDLSCELFLDGEQVAFNAPLGAGRVRTIRPDGGRYCERHEWVLNEARRVKLCDDGFNDGGKEKEEKEVTPRYNGVRPNYQNKRISHEDYPDPTTYGWKFTGSVEESYVEFFEKEMPDGSLVKLDFYYTTGTIKTILDHPTRGRNQLFRAAVNAEQFRKVMENPRVHTDLGYRRSKDRPMGGETNVKSDEKEDGMKQDEDEFDKVPTANQTNADTKMEEDDNGPKVSTSPKFYARNVSYDFKTQGHQNRQVEMNKLTQSQEYTEWKEANKREYAVIHAKFYVSIPKRMYRANANSGGRRTKQMEPLPVPEQAKVIDVKAAENCTLGTDYRSTGPSQSFARSNVRMERINGLTDEKEWKGDPVFEKKLYYRAEHIVNGVESDNDASMDEMSEDEDDISPAALAEYKEEKIEQVKQYHLDLSHYVTDEEEAEQLLRNAKNKIYLSASVKDVDESVNLFYNDLIGRQFASRDNYPI